MIFSWSFHHNPVAGFSCQNFSAGVWTPCWCYFSTLIFSKYHCSRTADSKFVTCHAEQATQEQWQSSSGVITWWSTTSQEQVLSHITAREALVRFSVRCNVRLVFVYMYKWIYVCLNSRVTWKEQLRRQDGQELLLNHSQNCKWSSWRCTESRCSSSLRVVFWEDKQDTQWKNIGNESDTQNNTTVFMTQ